MAQFLGQGGGREVANETMLGGLKSALGSRTGARAYEDLRQRNDLCPNQYSNSLVPSTRLL